MIQTTKKDLNQVIKLINQVIKQIEKEKKQNKAN
jgi:DNA-binding XRE family transcriptional regulator